MKKSSKTIWITLFVVSALIALVMYDGVNKGQNLIKNAKITSLSNALIALSAYLEDDEMRHTQDNVDAYFLEHQYDQLIKDMGIHIALISQERASDYFADLQEGPYLFLHGLKPHNAFVLSQNQAGIIDARYDDGLANNGIVRVVTRDKKCMKSHVYDRVNDKPCIMLIINFKELALNGRTR
ncbi:MAG: hypothetical protein KTR28_09335 [Micavibrio sp.]|nr:hypothetical protein [Micavibrio sp.]